MKNKPDYCDNCGAKLSNQITLADHCSECGADLAEIERQHSALLAGIWLKMPVGYRLN
jgi:hypothetical protein